MRPTRFPCSAPTPRCPAAPGPAWLPACSQSEVTLEFGQLAATGTDSRNLLRTGLGAVVAGIVLVGISRIRPWSDTEREAPELS